MSVSVVSCHTVWASDRLSSSVPQALLACCECGAKGCLGFMGSTIWNGALFNVAYVEKKQALRASLYISGMLPLSDSCMFFFLLDLWGFQAWLIPSLAHSFEVSCSRLQTEPDKESSMSSRPNSLKRLCALTLSSPLPSVLSFSETFLFSTEKNNTN